MRKISLVGLALVAVGAFFALATTSAFAALEFALAEWLNNGNVITSGVRATTTGELLFENTSNKADILCTLIIIVVVGPNGEDEGIILSNLGKTSIEELDGSAATKGISCTGDNLCETGSEIWPVNLPFLTLLVLDLQTGKWYDLVLENSNKLLPAYNINCKTIIGTVNELCVSALESGGEVVNVTGGVEPIGAIEPLSTCNGTAGVGLTESIAGSLIALESGGPLSVSG